jgi:hypothetical protein
MLRQLQILTLTAWRAARPVLRAAATAVWALLRPVLSFVLQVLAALILIFEEWGWKPLSEAMAWLARFKLFARLEAWIASLPPYGALLVFALPTTILLPLKLFSVWLLTNGYFLSAGALFIGAKIASTALVARIFMLTRPALMKLGWFARAYNKFMPWKDALFAKIRTSYAWRYGRMLKKAVLHESKQAWARWKPRLKELAATWWPRTKELITEARLRGRILWQTWRPEIVATLARLRQAWRRMIGVG